MTYDILEWRRATAEYREQLKREKIAEVLGAIEEPTKKDREKASNLAEAHALQVLWKTETYNGVKNPTWDDPIWRDPQKMAGYTPLESKPIPRAPKPAPRPDKATKTDIQRVREALRARA